MWTGTYGQTYRDNLLQLMFPDLQPDQLAPTSRIWYEDKVRLFMIIESH